MNVWVALMNVEHKFGTKVSLGEAVQRAAAATNPKRVHLHLAKVRHVSHRIICRSPSRGSCLSSRNTLTDVPGRRRGGRGRGGVHGGGQEGAAAQLSSFPPDADL